MITNDHSGGYLNSIKSEIDHHKAFDGLKIAPKYLLWFYYNTVKYPDSPVGKDEETRYYIIYENLYQSLDSAAMKAKFQSFDLPVKIFKVLQIANLIERLHAKGIVHLNINLASIVSIDAEMSDFRLVDFHNAVEVREKCRFANTIFYPFYNLKDKIYYADFDQDAHAFAVIIMYLFDENHNFENKIKRNCNKSQVEISEECNKVYKDKNMIISTNKNLNDLLSKLKSDFFHNNYAFDISSIIKDLIRVYIEIIESKEAQFAKHN